MNETDAPSRAAEPAPSPAAPPPAVSPAPSHADTPPPAPALQASATATANDTPGPDKPKPKADTELSEASAPIESKPPFGPGAGETGGLQTIDDPNLTPEPEKVAPDTATGPASGTGKPITELAEAPPPPETGNADSGDERSALDKFLRRAFSGKSTRDTSEVAAAETPKPVPEPIPAGEENAAEPAEAPETPDTKTVSKKLDGFIRGIFSAKRTRGEEKNGTESARGTAPETPAEAAKPAPTPKPEPAKPSVKPSVKDAKRAQIASLPVSRRFRRDAGPGSSEAVPYIPSVVLTVGESLTLGRTLSDAMNRAANCFQKGKNGGWYCLETADWPDEIRGRLEVSTWLYRKAWTIVHYRSGKAQRIFSVFPARNFNRVVRYLEAKFGPPAVETDQTIALIGAPPKLNINVMWNRKNPGGSRSVLEVRKYDNVRRMVPDTKIGFIRLYREGTKPIFRIINESDLMLQSLRHSRISLNSGKK